MSLEKIIDAMRNDGFFSNDFDEIDFYYDHSAMALAEWFMLFQKEGKLGYDDEDDDQLEKLSRVEAFIADKPSINFLLRYLEDIKNEVKDKDGDEREITELWKESDEWEQWSQNLNDLINDLKSINLN